MTDPRVPMAPKPEAPLDALWDELWVAVWHGNDSTRTTTARKAIENAVAAQSADALLALREALSTARDIIHANPGEDTCRHQEYVVTCDGDNDGPCVDRARREEFDSVLADTEQAAQARVKEIKEAAERDVRAEYMLLGHKCRPVAVMPMQEGRDWWLGELTEPLTDWPQETHCLHLKTPLKEVVLGIYRGDTDLLAVICRIVSGYIPTEHWMDTIESGMRKKAEARAFLGERDPKEVEKVSSPAPALPENDL